MYLLLLGALKHPYADLDIMIIGLIQCVDPFWLTLRLMHSVYGMGELQIIELAEALDKNRFDESLPNIRGICYMAKEIPSYCIEMSIL